MYSARRLMVFNVYVKFHENMSSGFKVMERTRKLLTDTHTHKQREKRRKHYTPMAYDGDIIIASTRLQARSACNSKLRRSLKERELYGRKLVKHIVCLKLHYFR